MVCKPDKPPPLSLQILQTTWLVWHPLTVWNMLSSLTTQAPYQYSTEGDFFYMSFLLCKAKTPHQLNHAPSCVRIPHSTLQRWRNKGGIRTSFVYVEIERSGPEQTPWVVCDKMLQQGGGSTCKPCKTWSPSPFSTTQQKLQEVDAGIPMVDGGWDEREGEVEWCKDTGCQAALP